MPIRGVFDSCGSRSRSIQVVAFLFCSGAAFTLIAPARVSAQPAGTVKVDGSSTVAPIMIAAAEMFQERNPRVRVTVGTSGTGGGFKKFLETQTDLRTDISNASRPISAAEIAKAAELGVEFIELPIAQDGLAVIVHRDNKFCDSLTLAELKRIWEPGSRIQNWKDVRPGFPDLALKLYGPGTDSGTFDYFTDVVMGKEKASRSDYMASENDNVLVQGVSGDRGSLGYFGFSYYEANKTKLKLAAIDGGDGKAIKPSVDAVRSGDYRPLSRPLFLYVNKQAAARPEVKAFLEFFFDNAKKIVEHPRVNYVALSDELQGLSRERFRQAKSGTVFTAEDHGKRIDLVERYRKR